MKQPTTCRLSNRHRIGASHVAAPGRLLLLLGLVLRALGFPCAAWARVGRVEGARASERWDVPHPVRCLNGPLLNHRTEARRRCFDRTSDHRTVYRIMNHDPAWNRLTHGSAVLYRAWDMTLSLKKPPRRSKQPDWSLKTYGFETPDPSRGFGSDPSI